MKTGAAFEESAPEKKDRLGTYAGQAGVLE